MRKYTQKELKNLARLGLAEDITTKEPNKELYHNCEKVGYSTGVYGLNGGLLQDTSTGDLYAITARSTALFYYF